MIPPRNKFKQEKLADEFRDMTRRERMDKWIAIANHYLEKGGHANKMAAESALKISRYFGKSNMTRKVYIPSINTTRVK